MRRNAAGCARAVLAAFALTASTAIAADSAGAEGTVTVREQPVAAEYAAYAQVRPVAVVPVRALEPGAVAAVRVEPGSPVTAGQPLATLSGPEIGALLTGRRGAVRSAQTRLIAARRTLAAETRQLAGQLSTRQAVAAARSAVAAAAADLQTAQAQLRVAQESSVLRAPSAGTVMSVDAGSGERVTAGQAVLTLQPRGSLWLEATYYGRDAASIHVGMQGRFEPASGSDPVRVKVASVFAALAADGGEKIGLVATGAGSGSGPGSSSGSGPGSAARPAPAAPWLNGEWGTVTVAGPARRMVAVPTGALILDRAKWWVLVRTAGGDRPRAVLPGPTRRWDTFIEKGLAPGQQVVVQNAYLEFHSGISRHYTPPD
ncbi:MAG: efflux RND transporter periplasmic adaptor subunit [Gammaproteobacteria bacterium]|nr:efflux RND transporter periplasmic adaptor subunit [Gammaproteobacteria bacterium]